MTPIKARSQSLGVAAVWPRRLAWLTACATALLLFVGGLVTSLGVGLAVPDWPTTFGYNMFLFPWSEMVGGVFFEHSHRLVASGVGLLTIALAVSLWLREPRRWVRWLGGAALVLVILQGILGGLRVIRIDEALAVLHACFAQVFFALVVSLTQFASPSWDAEPRSMARPHVSSLRLLCLTVAVSTYAQAVFGALLRHAGSLLALHVVMAGLIAGQILWLAARTRPHKARHPELHRPALLLGLLLAGQILLGLVSYAGKFWAWFSLPVVVLVTTSHTVTGAVMFATAVVLTLRCYRSVAPAAWAVEPASGWNSAAEISQEPFS